MPSQHRNAKTISQPQDTTAIKMKTLYRNAIQLSTNPFLAYEAGRRFHVSAFGMYGFAILSSANFRQTMYFAMKYHELAAPFAEISFKEEGGLGIWTILPLPLPHPEPALHRFLTEAQ